MTIYIGADHRGLAFKASISAALKSDGYEVIDVGAIANDPADDYPDFAGAVAEKVSAVEMKEPMASTALGIVICGSGFGADITANKFKGVRAALAMSPEHIRAGRHDDDVNILCLAANFISPETALEIARAFLSTPFNKDIERYVRRLNKITKIEEGDRTK